MKKCSLFILLLLTCMLLSGCGKNYKSTVYEYNNTVIQVNKTLKEYYKSLYEVNRTLYFQSKSRNKAEKISLEDIEKPENVKITVINERDLNIRIEAIDTLMLYSNYLVQIYNDDLKNLTSSTIDAMVNDIVKYSSNNLNEKCSQVIVNMPSAIFNKFVDKRRYRILKKYVNATNDTIVELLSILDDETINVLQNNVELRAKELLKDQIIYYNRYLAKKENDNSIETLRKIQLKEIQENYTYYDNIRKSNPQYIIKSMLKAQNELYAFVNNKKNGEFSLLKTVQGIQKSVSAINKFLP